MPQMSPIMWTTIMMITMMMMLIIKVTSYFEKNIN
uniref:ATP synthase F0 subunit 8 n=1 Tax=Iolania perkinsi TaxID=2831208 RepID=A0A8K1HZM5_9HEMI|nr:ATP synthase F0 subunit 8 [Iolania perkinsi]